MNPIYCSLESLCKKLVLVYEYEQIIPKKSFFTSCEDLILDDEENLIFPNNYSRNSNLADLSSQYYPKIYQSEGLIRNTDGTFEYNPINKKFMDLYEIYRILSAKFPAVDILNGLDWKEYESLIFTILEDIGYTGLHNYRFSYQKRRFEIDVIVRKGKRILAIDAKRWKNKTISYSSLKNVAKRQKIRVEFLQQKIKSSNDRSLSVLLDGLACNGQSLKIYPIIIVSSNITEIIFEDGVPIFSFSYFNSFLQNFAAIEPEIYSVSIDP